MDVLTWPDAPCASCPRVAAGLGLPCPAQARRNSRLCELVDPGHRGHNPDYRAVVLGECAEPAPAGSSPIPLAGSLARLAAMRACPHWTAASDCGCGLNRCGLGKGDRGAVSHADCFECLGL